MEVLSTFLPFPSFPQSNKFSQQRGTAPIGPGKEEQEEGARGRAGMRGERSRREAEGEEGGLEEWIQAPLVQCVSRREELWLQQRAYQHLLTVQQDPDPESHHHIYLGLLEILLISFYTFVPFSPSICLTHFFFLCCTLCSCTHSPLNQIAYQFMHMCMPVRVHFFSQYLCGSQIRHDHVNCSLETV